MKEVIEMPEKTILYPNLYLFYRYILLEERVLTEANCVVIYDLIPWDDMDSFWAVFAENAEHPNILLFARACVHSQLFLTCMYSEMKLKQITVISQHLSAKGVDYRAQINICLDWTDEGVEDWHYRIIRTLAEAGSLDMHEIIAEEIALREYLAECEEEV